MATFAFIMSTYGHSYIVAIGYCDVSRLPQAACGQVDQEKKTLKMYNNNNNRELIERFRKLKALYNLKKSIQSANTHNYTNPWYTSVQNIRKNHGKSTRTQDRARAHTHARTHARTHTHTHTHTQTHTHTHTHTH